MRTFVFLIVSLLSFSAVAQSPRIDSLYIPRIGDVVVYKECDTTNVRVTTGGANQLFDYRNIGFFGSKEVEYISPVGMIGFSFFSNATLANNEGRFIAYYRATKDSFLYLGSYDTLESYINSKWDYGFNQQLSYLKYDTLYVDTSFMAYYSPSDYKRRVIIKTKMDSYGTLLLPNNTYDTVYRVWREIKYLGFGNSNSTTENYYGYYFVSPKLKRTVFGIKYGQNGSLKIHRIILTESVRVKQSISDDSSLSVFPNPFTNELLLKGFQNKRIKGIRLFNLLGELITDTNYALINDRIVFHNNVTIGMYFLFIDLGDEARVFKLLKQ